MYLKLLYVNVIQLTGQLCFLEVVIEETEFGGIMSQDEVEKWNAELVESPPTVPTVPEQESVSGQSEEQAVEEGKI